MDLVPVILDGKSFAGPTMVVAVGITLTGDKGVPWLGVYSLYKFNLHILVRPVLRGIQANLILDSTRCGG